MKKIYIYSYLLILSEISAQGTVEINYFYSDALQVDCGYTIHLPESLVLGHPQCPSEPHRPGSPLSRQEDIQG